jgi:TetR/AcrR family transcriptional regulator, regulator of cefoperazone and chloramphenicol sensitivity
VVVSDVGSGRHDRIRLEQRDRLLFCTDGITEGTRQYPDQRQVRRYNVIVRCVALEPMRRCDQLDRTEHLFNNINMSSDPADLTSAAAIRIAAMKLFAERGYAGVTVRQIASAAGVSPALVIHHYGSKDRLRAVLEERVAAFVESMLAELARVQEEGASASIAELFADRLEREPALAGYVRRLLCDGGPAGVALFGRLYQATRSGMRALQQAGVVRPSGDDQVRDAFLLSNDLAMLLLRPLISQVTGIDPLARDGLVRWSAEVFDVYSGGVFTPAAPKEADTRDERR